MFPSVADKKPNKYPNSASSDSMQKMLEVLTAISRSQQQMVRCTEQLVRFSSQMEEMGRNSTETVRLLKRLDKRLGITNQKLTSTLQKQDEKESNGKYSGQKQEPGADTLLEIEGKAILGHLGEQYHATQNIESSLAEKFQGMAGQERSPERNPGLNSHILSSLSQHREQEEMMEQGMPMPNPLSMVRGDFETAARMSQQHNHPNPHFQGIMNQLQNSQPEGFQFPPGVPPMGFPLVPPIPIHHQPPPNHPQHFHQQPHQEHPHPPPFHPNMFPPGLPGLPPGLPPGGNLSNIINSQTALPMNMLNAANVAASFQPTDQQIHQSLDKIFSSSDEKVPASSIDSESNTVRVGFDAIAGLFANGQIPALKYLKYEISVWLGHFFRQLSNITYEQLITQKVENTSARLLFSQSLILNIFDLVRFFRRVNSDFWNRHRQELMEWMETCQRKILEFLKTKYPRNRRVFKPIELEKELDSINNSEDPRFDIIRNVGLSFKKMDNQSHYIRHIKLFFNRLIALVDKEYPLFHSNMKNILTAPDGGLDVKIGKKFKDNTPQFSNEQLETLHFKCRSPQILRILIKWVEEIEEMIDGPISILHKKAFKHVNSTVDNSVPVSNTMKQKVVDLIAKKKQQTMKQMERKHFQFHNLIDNIMELSQIRPDNTEFLSQDDLRTIKISKMVSSSIPFFVIDRIEHVINIIRSIPEELRGTVAEYIDLVTFKVFDLLRCKAKGTTKQIIHVYKQIKKASNYLTIIRVKDRLDTPLNDILINCKINDSPLICQIQLTTNTEDNFTAHTNDNFNHFLYELQRSKYGPVCEACLIINDSDPKMSYSPYLKKINFHMEALTQDELQRISLVREPKVCYRSHPLVFVRYESPFICSLCSQINYPYEAPFGSHECNVCNLRICCACWLENVDDNVRRDQFYLKSSKMSGNLYLPKYYQLRNYAERLHIDQIMIKILKTEGLKYCVFLRFSQGKIRRRGFKLLSNGSLCPTFYSYNFGLMDNLGKVERFDVIMFPKQDKVKKLQLKELKEFTDWELLSNHNSKPALDDKAIELNIGYVFQLDEKAKKILIIDYDQQEKNIEERLKDIEMMKILKECEKTKTSSLDISSLKLKSAQLLEAEKDSLSHVLSIVADQNQLTDINQFFCLSGLKKLSLKENKINEKQIKINLPDFIDIYLGDNLFESFPLMSSGSLKRLLFIQNNISNLDQLLNSNLPNLQELNLNFNLISQFPIMKMPKLKKLFLTNNQIKNLDNLPKCHFPVVELLKFDTNLVSQIPTISFPTLNFFGLKNNKIKDISNFKNCHLPNLNHLRLSQNFIETFPIECDFPILRKVNVEFNQLTDITTIVNKKFKDLEQVLASHNKISTIGKLKSKNLKRLDLSFNNIVFEQDEHAPFYSSSVPQLEEIIIKEQSDGRVFTEEEVLKAVERVIPLLRLIK